MPHSPYPAAPAHTPSRARFIAAAVSQVGAPYLWNGKGELLNGRHAFDCSGLVTWAYKEAGGPDWRATHNSDMLFAELPEVPAEELQTGDLLFWGTPAWEGRPADPEHVGIYLGAGALLSAAGGGQATRTLEDALRARARVRPEASIHYRKDFLGARQLLFAK